MEQNKMQKQKFDQRGVKKESGLKKTYRKDGERKIPTKNVYPYILQSHRRIL